jgi:DNA-binding Xre family transcriptional regulator
MVEKQVRCKLRKLMDAKEINQLQLSRATGLAPSTIGRMYRDQISRFDAETINALVKFFEIKDINELLTLETVEE